MTNSKILRIADLRNLEKKVALGQISYGRMVEILNEMAYEWHTYKLQQYITQKSHS